MIHVDNVAAWDEARRSRWLARMSDAAAAEILSDWHFWRRAEQIAPDGDWRIWLLMAGRGFGKTRTGAEWVHGFASASPGARIALVGATLGEARSVMVEGESGIMRTGTASARPVYESSLRRLTWPNGAEASLYGAGEPDTLRGPEHHAAWCDEIGKWHDGVAVWDNLMMTLRLGSQPRVVATTTPRGVPLVRRLLDEAGVAVTRGRTAANRANMAAGWYDAMQRIYGGTRLGRQELDGEMLSDVDGALWTRALVERCRVDAGVVGKPVRVVIGVDPPATARGDACGIIVAAQLRDGRLAVVEDASVTRPTPARWAAAVAAAAARWHADCVIAESNMGGDMVAATLTAADVTLPVKAAWAQQGKSRRAEPVAMRYERGDIVHAGRFPALEDELCGMLIGGGYEGPGRSPDRADAAVWALSALGEGMRKGRGVGVRVV